MNTSFVHIKNFVGEKAGLICLRRKLSKLLSKRSVLLKYSFHSKALEIIQSFNPEKNKNATLIPVATEIRGSFREIYGNKECLKHVIILSTVAFCVRLIKLGASLQFIELLQQSQLPETRSCFIRKSVDIEKKCRKLETKDYEWEILAATRDGRVQHFLSKKTMFFPNTELLRC